MAIDWSRTGGKYQINSKDIDKLFAEATQIFLQEFLDDSLELGVIGLATTRNIRKQIYKKVESKLKPLVAEYFAEQASRTNTIMKSHISKLVDQTKVPFKWNKDLLMTYNDTKSVFSGYYDVEVKSVFNKREIDQIKRVILQGKYGGWTDRELQTAIRNAVNTTKNRALNIARIETTRLQSAANSIYYSKPAVKAKYNLVFHTQEDDKVRKPEHSSYNGKVADEDGYFDGACGKITGAPVPCSPWNCRCRTDLELKPNINT